VKEVHLNDKVNGTFEGTGTGENDTTYQLKVTYSHSESEGKVKNELRWEGEDGKDNRIQGQTGEGGGRLKSTGPLCDVFLPSPAAG
jgi:hypothetical protein